MGSLFKKVLGFITKYSYIIDLLKQFVNVKTTDVTSEDIRFVGTQLVESGQAQINLGQHLIASVDDNRLSADELVEATRLVVKMGDELEDIPKAILARM